MAIARDMTPAFYEYMKTQPESAQIMMLKYPPELLYMHKNGLRLLIESYNEDGTVDVSAQGIFNPGLVGYKYIVEKVNPEELTECDIPDCCEPV